MKKKLLSIAATIICAAFCLCGCSSKPALEQIKESGRLVVYTNALYPPFEYTEDTMEQTLMGVDMDIMNAICSDLGVEPQYRNISFSAVISSVSVSKNAVAISAISITDERREKVDFSVPYYVSEKKILLPAESDVKCLEDLAGKTVGAEAGSTSETVLLDAINGNDKTPNSFANGVLIGSSTNRREFTSGVNAIKGLADGTIDALIIDGEIAEYAVAENRGMVAVPLTLRDGSTYREEYAVAVPKNNPELLAEINKTIERLKNDGEIDVFLRSHFDSIK